MTPIRKFAPALLVALLTACSAPAPAPTHYLMRGEPIEGVRKIESTARVGIGRVILAPYLTATPGIVVETTSGQVQAARQHQWAEPLESGIRWFTRVEISQALGRDIGGGITDLADWDYTIDLYVSRFHGMPSGALLETVFVIRATADRSITEYRFSRSEPLTDRSYEALVAAQQQLLRELAAEIAAALGPLLEPQS
jgi:uncharacterized lipoprotein YmbA